MRSAGEDDCKSSIPVERRLAAFLQVVRACAGGMLISGNSLSTGRRQPYPLILPRIGPNDPAALVEAERIDQQVLTRIDREGERLVATDAIDLLAVELDPHGRKPTGQGSVSVERDVRGFGRVGHGRQGA
ncbi:hypothetical protein THIOKS11840041 [Thiocapsa sp. KS1]|nr:hypothetical protein THIOKS11840041 [Thiocapsa sp. KS1]